MSGNLPSTGRDAQKRFQDELADIMRDLNGELADIRGDLMALDLMGLPDSEGRSQLAELLSEALQWSRARMRMSGNSKPSGGEN